MNAERGDYIHVSLQALKYHHCLSDKQTTGLVFTIRDAKFYYKTFGIDTRIWEEGSQLEDAWKKLEYWLQIPMTVSSATKLRSTRSIRISTLYLLMTSELMSRNLKRTFNQFKMENTLIAITIVTFAALLFFNIYFRIKSFRTFKQLAELNIYFTRDHVFDTQRLEKEILSKHPDQKAANSITRQKHENINNDDIHIVRRCVDFCGATLMYFRQ